MSELALCQSECVVSLACFDAICEPANLPGDDPTPLQTAQQTNAFPGLHCFNVLAPADKNYNCISWSVGNDTKWTWKEVDSVYGDKDGIVEVSDFDAFYLHFGFTPAADCSFEIGKHKVALFGTPDGPTHAARQAIGLSGWWESEEGREKKSLHQLNELEGGAYGNVIKCYERRQP